MPDAVFNLKAEAQALRLSRLCGYRICACPVFVVQESLVFGQNVSRIWSPQGGLKLGWQFRVPSSAHDI
jgi:hypothetical protein